ncbi:hypothetical protein SH668x_000159 [Planctomicrobium sp. SH668]|uniref:hypothetical protein n=1 Tax=Planctomicrobium sp. SH668 TaxID=3448126 RepID=UPI003F5C9796
MCLNLCCIDPYGERLLALGKRLGRAIESLLTIVSPSTIYRWLRDEGEPKWKKNLKGGPRKPRELRELVIQIAKATGFGYTRIIGELRKLALSVEPLPQPEQTESMRHHPSNLNQRRPITSRSTPVVRSR